MTFTDDNSASPRNQNPLFTDSDLKRLKDEIKNSNPSWLINIESDILRALLSRLEAAEVLISMLGTDLLSSNIGKVYEVWRKAAGK